MSRRVLVIAAHPDDELLGCGGTVALHTKAGDEVTSVIVCEGESLRYGQNGVGQAEHIRRAAAALGVCDVRPLGFADQRLDTLPLTWGNQQGLEAAEAFMTVRRTLQHGETPL